jgi:hypothetical protein
MITPVAVQQQATIANELFEFCGVTIQTVQAESIEAEQGAGLPALRSNIANFFE